VGSRAGRANFGRPTIGSRKKMQSQRFPMPAVAQSNFSIKSKLNSTQSQQVIWKESFQKSI
jgi:hypothetical protein